MKMRSFSETRLIQYVCGLFLLASIVICGGGFGGNMAFPDSTSSKGLLNADTNNNNRFSSSFKVGENFLHPENCRILDLVCGDGLHLSNIDFINSEIRPKIAKLVNHDFFKYFKLQLYKKCPFWQESPMCFNPTCAVEVEEDNRTVDGDFSFIYNNSNDTLAHRKIVYNCDFCNTNESREDDAVLVDLTINPERFSGYGGEEASKIWSSIYQENCFNKPKVEKKKNASLVSFFSSLFNKEAELDFDQCIEKKAFYRLVSGMHASIATHLSYQWLNKSKRNAEFEPNLQLWLERVGYYPDRLSNIYFNYALVMKSLIKLKNFYNVKDIQMDPLLEEILNQVEPLSGTLFNENAMFNYENDMSNQLLKDEFKANFKNVTALMDCVGCERCRLWGKLQTLGYGTALKILFELNNDYLDLNDFHLNKMEFVALVNTFDRLSKSINSINYFRDVYLNGEIETTKTDDAVETQNANSAFLNENQLKVSYQQKIFSENDTPPEQEIGDQEEKGKQSNQLKENSNESQQEKSSPVVVKSAKDTKKKLKKVFKKKLSQGELNLPKSFKLDNGFQLDDVEEFFFDDLDNINDILKLASDELQYRKIFKNSLTMKFSKEQSDKTFSDLFWEVIEEFKDVFRFLYYSYLYFPSNLYKIILQKLSIWWNQFVGVPYNFSSGTVNDEL